MSSARRFASAGIAFAALGIFLGTPAVAAPLKAAIAILPLAPLLRGARASDPFQAAWWSSIALNLLVAFWMIALALPG